MTKGEGQSIDKDLAEVKSTTEGLKTDINGLLKDQDELKAHMWARVRKLSMDYSRRRNESLMCYGLLVFALYCFKACIPYGFST